VVSASNSRALTFGEAFDTESAGKNIPAGFISLPEDIARLAIFLASDEARYIGGQTIVCDGGQTLIMPQIAGLRGRRSETWTPAIRRQRASS